MSAPTLVDPRGMAVDLDASNATIPPPPHDPRERGLALKVSDWEVRVFGGRKFQYFVRRGLWHVQLWHPRARISVLTPSHLTRGFYEAFPIADWKGRAPTYDALIEMLGRDHAQPFLREDELARIERVFVTDVVDSRSSYAS